MPKNARRKYPHKQANIYNEKNGSAPVFDCFELSLRSFKTRKQFCFHEIIQADDSSSHPVVIAIIYINM